FSAGATRTSRRSLSPIAAFLRNGTAASGIRDARSGSAEHPAFWRSLTCEKRSAEWAGRSGAWEDTCGGGRMCPDKPPSCYLSPTLGESRPERLDCHPNLAVGHHMRIVADG